MNKKIILSILFLGLMQLCYAADIKSPQPFIVNGKKAVWSDFKKAKYNIFFDINTKKSFAYSEITFEISQTGYPIFDVLGTPTSVKINNVEVGQLEIDTPNKESKVRIAHRKLTPGTYLLSIKSPIVKGVSYKKGELAAGFFMKDMKDRELLERYIPANYEYDQFKINLSIHVNDESNKYELFTNGEMQTDEKGITHVSYPEYFTSSSLYFHLTKKSKFKRIDYKYRSVDGRDLPITIYSKSTRLNRRLKRKVNKVIKELEGDYGPWPHPQFILYGTGKLRGGMEYAGAAVSGWFAVGHELQHNYFARSVMPANGDAGWIDEAVASWRDFFSLSRKKPKYDSMNLGNHGQYVRKTDKRSYKSGRSFMAYINNLLKKESSKLGEKCLKDFFKEYYIKNKFKTITSESFRSDLEAYAGRSFKEEFKRYIYGNNMPLSHDHHDHAENENPYHPDLTDEQLNDLL